VPSAYRPFWFQQQNSGARAPLAEFWPERECAHSGRADILLGLFIKKFKSTNEYVHLTLKTLVAFSSSSILAEARSSSSRILARAPEFCQSEFLATFVASVWSHA
jgi:hypothetical protein